MYLLPMSKLIWQKKDMELFSFHLFCRNEEYNGFSHSYIATGFLPVELLNTKSSLWFGRFHIYKSSQIELFDLSGKS